MTGTTFYTKTGGNYSTTLYMTYQVTGQSVSGNYSDLTIRAYIKYSGGTSTSSSYSSGYFILDGTTVESTGKYSISSGGEHLFGSVAKRVYHNSDGTFPTTSVSYSCKNYHFGTTSGSGTISAGSVSRIARTSSISVNDSTGYYCGSTAYFTISRQDSSFTHELYYQLSGGSWTHFKTEATTSANLSIPTSWESSYMGSSTYMDFAIYCETYSNGTYVGTASCSCRALVRAASVYSISSVSAVETASEMTALNWGVYVAGHSKIKFTMSYSDNSNGASIKSISWDFNYQSRSGTSTTWTTGTLQYGSTSGQAHTLTVTITDSRGRAVTKTFSYTVYSISPPAITGFAAYRSNAKGVADDAGGQCLTIKSTYTDATSPNGKNPTTRTAYYKLNTDLTWTTLGTVTSDEVTYTSPTLELSHSYDVKVVVSDAFSSPYQQTALLSGERFIHMRESKDGLSLGKYSEQAGLEVNWPEWHYKTETHSGAETHSGSETHSGTETHSGDANYSGTLTASAFAGGQSGTWTPVMQNGGSSNYTNGSWYKIGCLVFIKGYIEFNVSSAYSSSNQVAFSGLPFTPSGEAVFTNYYCTVQTFTSSARTATMHAWTAWTANANGTVIARAFWNGRDYSLPWNCVQNSGGAAFSGCYLTNE